MTSFFKQERALIIAEVAQAHEGSLGMAHAFIDAIAKTGADAVKFQTHIAEAESTPHEPWRVPFSLQDKSRFDYWKRMEFSEAQWGGLKAHAQERGLLFMSSPFSIQAIKLLQRIGIALWKVASPEALSPQMMQAMQESQLPMIISTGLSNLEEIDAMVARLTAGAHDFALLQCTNEYPCPPEHVGLNVMTLLQERYGCAAGLSDHSGTPYPSLAAATLGARVLEVHVTMSREMFGPDVAASLTLSELTQMVRGVRWIETMRAHPIDKHVVSQRAEENRRLFLKSMVVMQDLQAGTRLDEAHVAFKKPAIGISAAQASQFYDRPLKRSVHAGEFLRESDF